MNLDVWGQVFNYRNKKAQDSRMILILYQECIWSSLSLPYPKSMTRISRLFNGETVIVSGLAVA